MKIIDTTFLIDLVHNNKEAVEITKTNEIFLTTQINMFEFIRGLFYREISEKKFKKILELFENIRVLSLDDKSLIKSAEISINMLKNGEKIEDNDCLIVGIALSNNVTTIITRNKHFERIKGIKVETY